MSATLATKSVKERAAKLSPQVAKFSGCKRGDTINPTPGTQGRFVGVTPGGTLWVAFPEHDFDSMAANFDRNFARR